MNAPKQGAQETTAKRERKTKAGATVEERRFSAA
jgi:hypothetical protein